MTAMRLSVLVLLAATAFTSENLQAQTAVLLVVDTNARGLGQNTFDSDDYDPIDLSLANKPIALSTPAALAQYFPASAISTGIARGNAAPGDLGLYIQGQTFANNAVGDTETGFAQVSVRGTASWKDSSTFFRNLATPGTPHFVTWNLFLDGNISASSSGPGSGAATFSIADIGDSASTFPASPYGGNVWGYAASSSAGTTVLDIPGGISVTTTLLSGQSVNIGYEIRLIGNASSDPSFPWIASEGGFEADVSGSLHWGGITSVTDINGNVIPRDQWTIVSESGFDYSKPFQVPEPSSAILFGAAVGVQFAARTKRLLRLL